jgi:SAM-dependent methyltransferase
MADAPKFIVEFGQDGAPPEDGRLDAPAFHRNREAIADVLVPFLESHAGHVLEIGSGTGQHAVDMASRMPSITWWPTDFNDSHLRSIAAWRRYANLPNLKKPIRLDASAADWQLEERGLPASVTVMFCANVIHIAPWAVAEGLFAGANRHLRAGGQLWLYGPFRREGKHNAPSNAAFDQSLRRQNPEWGVRDTAELRELAQRNNLAFKHTYELPSNNAILTFEQSS